MTVPISMIAAVGENGVIGNQGELPWHLPSDFAFFKRMTLGKPLIMGRKTLEGIGKPLPGRTNIAVTHRPDFALDGVVVTHSLDEALAQAQEIAAAEGAPEVMIGGGGEIYREAMPLAHRLYITHVAASPQGDARFPPIDPAIWAIVHRHDISRGEKDSADFTVLTYGRRG